MRTNEEALPVTRSEPPIVGTVESPVEHLSGCESGDSDHADSSGNRESREHPGSEVRRVHKDGDDNADEHQGHGEDQGHNPQEREAIAPMARQVFPPQDGAYSWYQKQNHET